MSGDYTRFTFKPSKNFSGVRKQQGRVDLDADWNEEGDIQDRRWRAETMDIFNARCVVPRQTEHAFEICVHGNTLRIGPGRMYVDGLLVENHWITRDGKREIGQQKWNPALAEMGPDLSSPAPDDWLTYELQPYLPNTGPISKLDDRGYLVYLDVWQREVTHVEDPDLLEKALGGVDTTTRLQTVWQVKLLPLEKNNGTLHCDSQIAEWERLVAPPAGRLKVSADAPSANEDPCVISPSGGYRGLENRLYRVEIHKSTIPGKPIIVSRDPKNPTLVIPKTQLTESVLRQGQFVQVSGKKEGEDSVVIGITRIADTTTKGKMRLDKKFILPPYYDTFEIRPVATFKWSRDNGSVVSAVTEIANEQVTVESLGRDQLLRFKPDDVVEVLDDYWELHNEPGEMAHIKSIDEPNRKITLYGSIPVRAFAATLHTRIKKWDGYLPITNGPIEIEDGIKVSFDVDKSPDKAFRTGDYWVFAARTADGSVELLEKAPPRGIHHHYCKLAVITVDNNGTVTVVNDCRPKAPDSPVQKGTCCTVTVGDGGDYKFEEIQTAIDNALGITRICILPGTYELNNTIVISNKSCIISGCYGQHEIMGPKNGGPVFRIDNGQVFLEALNVHAYTSNEALSAGGSERFTVERCTIINDGCKNDSCPAIKILDCKEVRIADNSITGLPAVTVQAKTNDKIQSRVEICHNLLPQGGIKILGSSNILIRENKIGGGFDSGSRLGPGIILGGSEGVQILNNTIENMDGSGITTIQDQNITQEELSGLQETLLSTFGIVKDLSITGNRIIGCVREDPDCSIEVGEDKTKFGGGIVLTCVSQVRIHDNYIAQNGNFKNGYPTCGILIGLCDGLELTGNTIIENGLKDTSNEEENYYQAGVAVFYANAAQELGFAARIHNNVISCSAGQALLLIAVGAVSIVGNSLTSGGLQPPLSLLDVVDKCVRCDLEPRHPRTQI